MGRNQVIVVAGLLTLAVSGCSSGGGEPNKEQLAEQAHHGIDVTKMTEHEISALPKVAQEAVRAQIAAAKKDGGKS